jgi:hypothetical protein
MDTEPIPTLDDLERFLAEYRHIEKQINDLFDRCSDDLDRNDLILRFHGILCAQAKDLEQRGMAGCRPELHIFALPSRIEH